MDQSLVLTLEKEFSIVDIIRIQHVELGYLTDNFVVYTAKNQKYFLKCQRHETARILPFIEETELFFAKNAIPVICPLQTKLGNAHFIHEVKTYTLYPFVLGTHIPRDELTKVHIQHFAQNLAHMHMLSKNGYPLITSFPIQDFWSKEKTLQGIKKIREILAQKKSQDDFDRLTEESFSLKEKCIEQYAVVYSDTALMNDALLHGDYHDYNIFFNSAGYVQHIFDFEKACWGSRMFEINKAMRISCFRFPFEEASYEKCMIFLRAYDEIYPVDIDELIRACYERHYYSFHSLWFENEHYILKNTRTDSLMPIELAKLKYFSQNIETFVRRISHFRDSSNPTGQ